MTTDALFSDAELYALEAKAHAAGIDPRYCTWGHGLSKPKDPVADPGRLCHSCADRFQGALFDAEVTA